MSAFGQKRTLISIQNTDPLSLATPRLHELPNLPAFFYGDCLLRGTKEPFLSEIHLTGILGEFYRVLTLSMRPGNTMEVLIYAANVLYLLSYLVRDILYLRLLTIVAACCLVTYFYNQAEPLMTVVGWNLFFVTLNVLQLTRILLGRYRARAHVQHQTAESVVHATWSI